MTDDQQQQPPQFPAFPQGIQVAHPKQQGPLSKMLSKGLKLKMPKTGIKTNSTIKFGHRKSTTKKFKPIPYY